MTLQFKFVCLDNKNDFIKEIEKLNEKFNLDYMIDDYNTIVNIRRNSVFTYRHLLDIMTIYQNIENLNS